MHGKGLRTGLNLFEFDLCAGFFKLSLSSFCIILGKSFLEGGGSAFNSSFCFSKAKTGEFTNSLDDLDLRSSVETCENNVEFGLFSSSFFSSSSGSSNSNSSSSGNAKSVFYFFNKFCQLKERNVKFKKVLSFYFSHLFFLNSRQDFFSYILY